MCANAGTASTMRLRHKKINQRPPVPQICAEIQVQEYSLFEVLQGGQGVPYPEVFPVRIFSKTEKHLNFYLGLWILL